MICALVTIYHLLDFPAGDNHEDLVMSKMVNLGSGLGYNCTDCDYNSRMKSNMRHHVESKHLNLTYHCSICRKSQKSYKSWFLHIKLCTMRSQQPG